MNKLTIFFSLLGLAAVAAGIFGALHNQLSYSVGPSYFHDLKFAQFGISETLQNRMGAALVGWQASWWMGVLVGLPAFVLGYFMLARPQTYFAAGVAAIGVVILVTTFATVAGLAFGVIRLEPTMLEALPIPENVKDPMGFARAGIMHDMAYYGGAAGALFALWTMWRTRKIEANYRGA